MFKSASIYRIHPGWEPLHAEADDALRALRFTPCGPTQELSTGWIEPRGEAYGMLVESVAGQRILKLCIESKSVPSAVVKKKVQEMAEHIERETGRKPGKKERKDIKEEARLALLPQAFPRQATVTVWIDHSKGLLVADTTSTSRLDALMTALVQTFDGLSLSPLQTTTAPQTAMANWLTGEAPEALNIGRACTLVSAGEEKATVKFDRHNVEIDEVREHIKQGKLPTELALIFADRVAFTLTSAMQMTKLEFMGGVLDGSAAPQAEDFDGTVTIATGEIQAAIQALIDSLGGELARPEQAAMPLESEAAQMTEAA